MKEVAAKRYEEHCKSCGYNSINATAEGKYRNVRIDEHCIACGCNIDFKTHDMAQICPRNFWTAEVSPEEGEQIDTIVNQNEGDEKGE